MFYVAMLFKVWVLDIEHYRYNMANLHIFKCRNEIVFFLAVVIDAIELKYCFRQRFPCRERLVQQRG